MKDNLRNAAQAALETLEDVFGKDKIDVSAINNLRAALAKPVVKESLTTQLSDTPDSEKLKQMRERIESLRGLCKTAVGYLRDKNAEKQACVIANLIGDMEPPLKDMVSEFTAALVERDTARNDALELPKPLLFDHGGEHGQCVSLYDYNYQINRLHQCLRDVYEVWAGSEGIPAPTVASEAYLLSLVEQMRDAAKKGLNNG